MRNPVAMASGWLATSNTGLMWLKSNSHIPFEHILLVVKIHSNGFWLFVLFVLFDFSPVTTNSAELKCEHTILKFSQNNFRKVHKSNFPMMSLSTVAFTCSYTLYMSWGSRLPNKCFTVTLQYSVGGLMDRDGKHILDKDLLLRRIHSSQHAAKIANQDLQAVSQK